MEHLTVCRICLATDVKLYDMCKYRLKTAFENLTGFNVTNSHYLHNLCVYCGTMLSKFTAFRERCVQSQRILEVLFNQHTLVTTDHISTINRHTHNLAYPYTTQLIQNFDTTIVIKEETNEQYIKQDYNNFPEELDFDTYEDITIKDDTFDIDNVNGEMSKTADDSDEEPLSKKVKKKKRKKSKKDEYVKIKSENEEVNFPNKDQPKAKYNDELEHDLIILTKEEQIEELLLRKTSPNYLNSVYKCESCYKGFMTEATYKNHMFRHDPRVGASCCDVCSARCVDERALKAHVLIAHERRYTCKICGHVSKSCHKAKQHVSWHAGVTFRCGCGATFARHTTYLTHVRRRHATGRCGLCGDTFIGDTGLRLHMKKAHRGEKHTPTDTFECARCGVQFKSEEGLRRHKELSENCEDDTMRSCIQCGDSFESDDLLKEHLVMHQKANFVRTCEECSRTFPNERSFAAHRTRVHILPNVRRANKQSNCVCEICGYKCMSASSLAQHQRRHSGEKPFQCTFCPKKFSVCQRLQIHTRTHTGERPYQCTRCPKAFKHKAALNRHDRVHTGAKPYTCPQCGKSFSQSNSMKQHCAGVHMKMYIYSRRAANKQTQ